MKRVLLRRWRRRWGAGKACCILGDGHRLSEDSGVLQRIRPDVGPVFGQPVENVHGLPIAAGDEVRKQRDVIVAAW